MGLDMWYFKAKKHENALTVATTDDSEEVGYMRKCDLALDAYNMLTGADTPQAVIQVFSDEVNAVINAANKCLANLHGELDGRDDEFRRQLETIVEESHKALDSFNPDEENLFVVSYW